MSPALAGRFFTTKPPGKPRIVSSTGIVEETMGTLRQVDLREGGGLIHVPNSHLNTHLHISQDIWFSMLGGNPPWKFNNCKMGTGADFE